MAIARFEVQQLLPGHAAAEDACTRRLTEAIAASAGVRAAQLESTTGAAVVNIDYDSASLTPAELEHLAAAAAADVSARFEHHEYRLAGLHCSDCAAKVSAVAGRIAGIFDARANYATEKLLLTLDNSVAQPASVVSAIEGLGYRVLKTPTAASSVDRGGVADKASAGSWRLPADLRLSLFAGAALVVGFALQSAGAPSWAWLSAYLLAYAAGGWHATNHAVRAAARGRFDIDLLMVVAALGAASLGSWAEGALLLFLFSLGHALEHLAMNRARGAIRALGGLTPKFARVRRGGMETELPIEQLRIGDVVIVRPGERIPADGQVVSGASHVDQAPITGESMPSAKGVGDEVYAGTINADGALEVTTIRDPEDSTLARVIKAVESAQSAKAPSHRLTERFQRVFSPAVLGATVLLVALPPLFGVPFEESFMRAMVLLVASSPCALALATPSAVLAGIARGARSGVLIKGGAHLENAGMADVVVFDKTGTLTRGRPQLTDVVPMGVGEEQLLRLAAALESRSTHPLATAVLQGAEERGVAIAAVADFAHRAGHGLAGSVDDAFVIVGNRAQLTKAGVELSPAAEASAAALEQRGKTTIFVAVGDGQNTPVIAGILAVRDEPRPEAAAAIASLRRLGIKHLVMLTGDNELVARAVGAELGLDEVHAALLPEDKARLVRELRARYTRVIVVGDGINDAPAMAAADVAVAMGGAGSAVALETADVALMADDLSKLPYAISLSRASKRMILQNLFVSLGVIALLLPSALFGLASIGVAVVIHESSTLVVVGNALRLLRFKGRGVTAA